MTVQEMLGALHAVAREPEGGGFVTSEMGYGGWFHRGFSGGLYGYEVPVAVIRRGGGDSKEQLNYGSTPHPERG